MKNYGTIERTVPARTGDVKEKRSFLIELSLACHVSSYGLLGATFYPKEGGNELKIEVRTNEERVPYPDSISLHKGYSYLGLESEYAQAVLDRAVAFFSGSAPSGMLLFDTAAYCDVGSSIAVFSLITQILLEILFDSEHPVSENQIKEICERCVAQQYENVKQQLEQIRNEQDV